jgi:endonuclease/exonuclease/phosphatase (EEP) superfamily protein YafD
MAHTRPFLSPSVRIDGVLDVLILLALSGSWFGLFGHWHWFLDLFSHFRWQCLIISAIAVAWSFWRKRRTVAGISILTFFLNSWLIGSLIVSTKLPAGKLADDFKLRVVSLNVLTSNQRHADVLGYLRTADADVIFLMEIDAAWAAALEPLKQSHPHHLLHPRQDNFGLALFSRVQLQKVRVVHKFEHDTRLNLYQTPTIEARLRIGTRDMTIYGIHPVPPGGSAAWHSRNDQLRDTALQIATRREQALVIGDINSTPWCEGMRSLRKDSQLDFRSTTPPWTPTWCTRSVFAIPIDHALCTPPLVIRRKIGPDLGSDHLPQLVEVGWMKPE